MNLETLVILAGLGQLTLIGVMFVVPRVLKWDEQLKNVRALTRQIFWTYAGYILSTNVLMGLVSVFGAGLLLDKTPLATMVCGYIFLYWTARVVLQFTYYGRKDAPNKPYVKYAEVYLVSLFIFCSFVYGNAVVFNLQG